MPEASAQQLASGIRTITSAPPLGGLWRAQYLASRVSAETLFEGEGSVGIFGVTTKKDSTVLL